MKQTTKEKPEDPVQVGRDGGMAIDINAVLDLFEMDDDDDGVFDRVVIDTVSSGAHVLYEELPKMIAYLQRVWETRVLRGDRAVARCPDCGQIYL